MVDKLIEQMHWANEALIGWLKAGSIRDILLHVATHGFHHRGQLAAKASALGAPLPNVAYIHYTRTVTRR